MPSKKTNITGEDVQTVDDLDFSEKVPGLFSGGIYEDGEGEPEVTEGSDDTGKEPSPGRDESEGKETEVEEPESPRRGEQPVEGVQEQEGTGQEEEEQEEGRQEERQDEPLVVLKRYGKEYPVYEVENLVRLAQMGLDYTLKTQQLAGWQKVIQTLISNPDLMDLVDRRMRGEVTALPEQPRQEQQPRQGTDKGKVEFDIPPQGDDESFEEYVARVASLIADRKTKEAVSTLTAQQQYQQVISQVRQDPLFEYTAQVISYWLANKQIPAAIARQADVDPQAFLWLYTQARQAVEQYIASTQGQEQKKPEQRVSKASKPPVVESGKSARLPEGGKRKSPWEDDKVIKDLSDDELENLIAQVKSGRI